MQTTQPKTLLLFTAISFRYASIAVSGLLLCSVFLSYVFQEMVFHNHCITKLGIILLGNLVFWASTMPIITTFSNRMAGNKYFIPGSLGLGVVLLVINQVLIQKAIYIIFLYGFGCLEGVTNSCYMLFENNILTSALIYCILALVAWHRATGKRVTEVAVYDTIPETKQTDRPAYKSSITIKNNGTTFRVQVQDIRYIESCRNTILIFTRDKKHVLYQSMVSIEKELDPECFVKIHRAFLVNRSFIHSCTGIGNGNMLVKLTCGAELVMTRHYKTQVAF
jgi:hypothetical protein